LEVSVLKNPEVHGGSGFAAPTVGDLGFESTLGATSGEGKARRVKKKVIEIGEGLSAAGVSAGGVSAGGVSGGALLSLKDMVSPSQADVLKLLFRQREGGRLAQVQEVSATRSCGKS
jgi:hypothetical protein